jgi:hypothetical protein
MKTRRREMLVGAAAAAVAAVRLPAPAIAQGIEEFKLVLPQGFARIGRHP